jgi:hypothetical protein
LSYFALRLRTPGEVVAAVFRSPVSGCFRAYHTTYIWAEDVLIERLVQFDAAKGDLEGFEQVLGGLVYMESRRGLRPIIHHLPTHFIGSVTRRGRFQLVYPAERAILHIGEPAFMPLIDEFIHTADDPLKNAAQPHGRLHNEICGVLSEGMRVSRALDEAKRRLFAKPDDKKSVRACKKLIRCLMANDYNRTTAKSASSRQTSPRRGGTNSRSDENSFGTRIRSHRFPSPFRTVPVFGSTCSPSWSAASV